MHSHTCVSLSLSRRWAAEFPGGIIDERLAQKWRKRAVDTPPPTSSSVASVDGSSGAAVAGGVDGALPIAPPPVASKPSRLLQGLSDAAAAATTKLRQVPDAKACLSCGQGTVKPEREVCKICGARKWGPPSAAAGATAAQQAARRRSFAEHQNLDDSRDGCGHSHSGAVGGGGSDSGVVVDQPPVGGGDRQRSSGRQAPPSKADGEALTRAIRMGVPPELREVREGRRSHCLFTNTFISTVCIGVFVLKKSHPRNCLD